jgi:16S rRNA (cytosine1402-N4)-methyltransferase
MYHVPVLLHDCIDGLNIKPDGIYVDVTFGGGGHSGLILEKLGPNGRLVAFDKDNDAGANRPADERFQLVKSDFRFLKNYLNFLKINQIDGILADLGVSSHQFDTAERGFSFRFDARLDMRMDQNAEKDAAFVLNSYDHEQLSNVLYEYGEFTNSRRIADALLAARTETPLETTFQLNSVLRRFYRERDESKFLARIYQAIRIEVNGELESLKTLLEDGCEMLTKEGRFVVLSYHSLEDRLVKNYFRAGKYSGEPDKDFYGNVLWTMKPVKSKITKAGEEELKVNSRARSAKLRIAEKL